MQKAEKEFAYRKVICVSGPSIIKKRSIFLRISRSRFRVKTSTVVVLCVKSDSNISEVGYTASKKVGNAVLRNKAKRRLRSLVRSYKQSLLNGYSFVFIANTNTAVCEFTKLDSDFIYSIKKLIWKASK